MTARGAYRRCRFPPRVRWLERDVCVCVYPTRRDAKIIIIIIIIAVPRPLPPRRTGLVAVRSLSRFFFFPPPPHVRTADVSPVRTPLSRARLPRDTRTKPATKPSARCTVNGNHELSATCIAVLIRLEDEIVKYARLLYTC